MIKTLHYDIPDLILYINWTYFFHAWGFPPRFGTISSIHGCDACRAGWLASFPEHERQRASEAMQLFKDAQRVLAILAEDFHTHVRFGLFKAQSEDEDIILFTEEGKEYRLPLLRQQHNAEGGPYLCLADFVSPHHKQVYDTVGVFAGTIDPEVEHLYEEGACADDFKHLLCQTLADRLTEAAIEKMHEEVRRTYWGYAPDENLTTAELFLEKFQGIRPAIGYPSLPDQSLNIDLARILDFEEIGIHLTENGAMVPHGSVSGLMIAHPASHYFSIGPIGEDQLEDYARRRHRSKEEIRKFLAANL